MPWWQTPMTRCGTSPPVRPDPPPSPRRGGQVGGRQSNGNSTAVQRDLSFCPRFCLPLTLGDVANISAVLAARCSPPLAFIDAEPHEDARPPANERSHAQYLFRPQGSP